MLWPNVVWDVRGNWVSRREKNVPWSRPMLMTGKTMQAEMTRFLHMRYFIVLDYIDHLLRYKIKILLSYFRASGDSVAQSPVMQNSSNEYNFPSDSESLKMVRCVLYVNITGFALHQKETF